MNGYKKGEVSNKTVTPTAGNCTTRFSSRFLGEMSFEWKARIKVTISRRESPKEIPTVMLELSNHAALSWRNSNEEEKPTEE